ncbi:MAG: DUF302 domain-containing protein [Granulosicoccus sp.]|nr:DUF302 domain-containing protein [Granulosicoccus sp.]
MSSALIRSAILFTGMVAVVISGCSSDSNNPSGVASNDASGDFIDFGSSLITLDSVRPVDEAMGALLTALNENDAITALPVIDHQANAASIDESLRPTSVQLFGNPALGTPLMQHSQLVGLDLPQKIIAWENEDAEVKLAYNSVDYLQQRHSIEGDAAALEALTKIGNALNALATNASGSTDGNVDRAVQIPIDMCAADDPCHPGQGIDAVVSSQDMETTYAALVSAIENSEALRVFVELDHAANAQTVGMELNPTRLVIFGNPNAGTPLMQAEQSIGIDLPQKMLVFENEEGVVRIVWNDPLFLATRHGIEDQDERLAAISGVLEGLANEAAGIVVDE